MRKCKLNVFLIGIIGIIGLAGCKSDLVKNEEIIEAEPAVVSMENEAVLSYEVPRSKPHILVDQAGYQTEHTKMAMFFGDIMPETFDVIDADSNQTVYTGVLEKHGYSEDYQDEIGYGDFSVLDKEGRYYIKSDLLGESYCFEIRDDIYKNLIKQVSKAYYFNRCGMTLTANYAKDKAHNACHTGGSVLREDINIKLDVSGGWHQDLDGSQNVDDAAKVIANILLAYEIFPNVFTDDMDIPESGNGIPDILDEVRYEIEWLLKMQDASVGAVYSGVTVNSSDFNTVSYVEPFDDDAAMAFAFSLAKFSNFYQNYDKEYATECLRAADRAWKYATLSSKGNEETLTWKLAASAEIYRASGHKECKDYIEKRISKEDIGNNENPKDFYGYVTYINTPGDVDISICDKIIKSIMLDAEMISERARNAIFLVPFDVEQSNNSKLLDDMITMSLVDYIIANNEYDKLICNYMHYFLGRNPESIVYLDEIGTYNYMEHQENLGIMKQFVDNSKLVFMLGKINSIVR